MALCGSLLFVCRLFKLQILHYGKFKVLYFGKNLFYDHSINLLNNSFLINDGRSSYGDSNIKKSNKRSTLFSLCYPIPFLFAQTQIRKIGRLMSGFVFLLKFRLFKIYFYIDKYLHYRIRDLTYLFLYSSTLA